MVVSCTVVRLIPRGPHCFRDHLLGCDVLVSRGLFEMSNQPSVLTNLVTSRSSRASSMGFCGHVWHSGALIAFCDMVA